MTNYIKISIFLISLYIIGCGGGKHITRGTYSSVEEDPAFMALYIEGNKQKLIGNYNEAINIFLQCLSLAPNNGACNFELSNLYAAQGNLATALKHALKAVDSDSKNKWYQSQLANIYGAIGEDKKAAEIFESLVEKYPDNINYYFNWAEDLLYADEIEEGIKVYDKIEKKFGINEQLSLQKKMLYEKIGQPENALSEIKKLVKWNPNEPRYKNLLADIYLTQGDKEKAISLYRSVLELDATNGIAHLALANIYKSEKNHDNYLLEMKLAFSCVSLDIDKKMAVILEYYDRTEYNKELLPEATDLIDIMISTHPNDPKGYSVKGDFFNREEKLTPARDMFYKALELDANRYPIWNEVLILDATLNDYQALLKDSKEALELFPANAVIYYFNGIALIQNKDYVHAVESLETGIDLITDNYALLEQFYQSLGDAYNAQKQYVKSDSSYSHALRIDPDNVYVLNNYAYYLSLRQQNLELAEKMSKHSNDLSPDSPSFQDTYGWILYKLDIFEEAEIWLKKAIDSTDETNGVILEHYGDLLFKKGRKNEALIYWKKALKAGNASKLINKKVTDKTLYE